MCKYWPLLMSSINSIVIEEWGKISMDCKNDYLKS